MWSKCIFSKLHRATNAWQTYTEVFVILTAQRLVKGAVSNFWGILLKVDHTEQHNKLAANQEERL